MGVTMIARIWLPIVLFVVLAGAAFPQTDFSADIVDLQKPGAHALAEFPFTQDRKRLDMQAASDEGAIVVRLSGRTEEKPATEIRVGGAG